jgi:hypothetical protein
VLLCWHHHELVHQRNVSVTRAEGAWQFTRADGRPVEGPQVDGPPPDGGPPATNEHGNVHPDTVPAELALVG